MDDKVTLCLPVHGRQEFIHRFIDLNLPFPILPMTDPGWFGKIAKGLEQVTTPYAMLVDCDDFPQRLGILRCVNFLETNLDYVCASGRIEGIWLFPSQIHGPLWLRSRQYSPYDTPANYGQDSISDRVLAGFANSWSYYAVYRTEALRTIWRECVEHDFKDFMVHEKFCAMRALTLGKAACLKDYTSLIRQYGTSQIASTRSDWWPIYKSKQSLVERNDLLEMMHYEGVDAEQLGKAWDRWYAERYQTFYGHPIRKRIGNAFPFLRRLSPLLEIMR